MTDALNFFRLYALVICDHAPAQRNVADFDFVSKVPHSNHHTVGQLAGKTMTVHPHSLLLYCTAMFVYVYQTTTFPLHCGDNVKVKTQHIYQAMDIPVLLRGCGEAVVTNDWRIKYSPCEDAEILPEGVQLCYGFFERIQISLYKRAIIGPPVKHHFNGDSLACR